MLMWCSMLAEGSELNVDIHKQYSQGQKIRMLRRTSKEEPMCKASVRFDDLWKHVSSGAETNCEQISTSIIPSLLRGPQQNSI